MKRINVFIGVALLALGLVPATHAVTTEKMDHDTFAEFSAGEFDNVSLNSDGHMELAPAMTNLASVTDPIIWAAVQDAQGDVFFGTGNQGKIYKLTPKGELSTFFAPNEVMVHALAIDAKGRLYAATSPNGRVYRLDAKGQAEVYCTPGETYIWAMTFGRDGSLFLATGDHGKILRIAPTESTPARAETYFETKEANITALATDNDGNLLAGTNPHGYLYRIDKANHGFVVFNSGDKEIKQIAVATNGVIYVSTFVANPKPEASADSSSITISISSTAGGGNASDDSTKAGSSARSSSSATKTDGDDSMAASSGAVTPFSMMSASGGSAAGGPSLGAIYRINTNGFYDRFWSAPGEAIYSMILLRDGSLLAGTGNKGRIYSIADANHWKLLQKTSDGAQVSALLADTGTSKEYFAATSHPAKVCRLDFSLAESGTYTAKALDAKQKSQWGKLHPDGDVPDGTKLEFSTRSGNTEKPEKTWSDWSEPQPLSAEIAVASPAARYLQYRVEFKRGGSSPGATAQLRRMQFYYQNQNAAPVISRVKVINEGFGVSKMPMPQMNEAPANLNQLLDGGGKSPANSANPAAAALLAMLSHPPLKVTKSPGLCTVVWDASDPNQDDLTYSVAIRAESEKDCTTLVDKTDDTFFSFDTTGFHEGLYFIKITASDLPSNAPETALTTEAISEAFLIDNTAPALTVKKQEVAKDHARIIIEAVDGASVISSASYSLDGKDDVALRPDDLIFDSTRETFTVELNGLGKGPHSFLLHVQDEAKNTSVLKLNFAVE
jgi:hypothetical protein